MSDPIKRLEKVDEMLAEVDGLLDDDQFWCHKSTRDARQELQETTKQIRESQQAAIELLIDVQDATVCPPWASSVHHILTIEQRGRIAKIIGLLGGSAKEEGEDESDTTSN